MPSIGHTVGSGRVGSLSLIRLRHTVLCKSNQQCFYRVNDRIGFNSSLYYSSSRSGGRFSEIRFGALRFVAMRFRALRFRAVHLRAILLTG